MIYYPRDMDESQFFVFNSCDTASAPAQFTSATTSTAYPLANLALFMPFSVPVPCIAYEGWVMTGTLTGGNFDIGIYDPAGTRLTSSGSTARSGASALTNTTAMTNYTLLPNNYYYLAFSAGGTDNYLAAGPSAAMAEAGGILEATSAFALPSSVTYARTTRTYWPYCGLNFYTVAF